MKPRGKWKTGDSKMSVLESHTAARPTIAEMKPQIGREFAHQAVRRDSSGSNPYSPVACFSLLLIVGLFITIGPAIHAYFAHN
jgi:hypothetical protein